MKRSTRGCFAFRQFCNAGDYRAPSLGVLARASRELGTAEQNGETFRPFRENGQEAEEHLGLGRIGGDHRAGTEWFGDVIVGAEVQHADDFRLLGWVDKSRDLVKPAAAQPARCWASWRDL